MMIIKKHSTKHLSENRRRIFSSLFWFFSINAFVTILIGYQYILHAAGVEYATDNVYLHLALCSNFFLLYLTLAFVLFPIFWVIPRKLPLFF